MTIYTVPGTGEYTCESCYEHLVARSSEERDAMPVSDWMSRVDFYELLGTHHECESCNESLVTCFREDCCHCNEAVWRWAASRDESLAFVVLWYRHGLTLNMNHPETYDDCLSLLESIQAREAKPRGLWHRILDSMGACADGSNFASLYDSETLGKAIGAIHDGALAQDVIKILEPVFYRDLYPACGPKVGEFYDWVLSELRD